MCVACKNKKVGSFCVNECDKDGHYEVNGTCLECHDHCLGCNGPEEQVGPKGCKKCKHRDGSICVIECPADKYDDNGECKPCNENCKSGCKGPENILGPNGCDACKSKKNGSYCVMECNKATQYADGVECKSCHEDCNGCKGPENIIGGNNGCNECKDKKYNNVCIKKCPSESTYEKNGVCHTCHAECCTSSSCADPGCRGPGSKLDENGCNSCNKVLAHANNACVKECLPKEYKDYGHCKPCDPTCGNGCKGPGSEHCDGCAQRYYREKLSDCNPGARIGDYEVCILKMTIGLKYLIRKVNHEILQTITGDL